LTSLSAGLFFFQKLPNIIIVRICGLHNLQVGRDMDVLASVRIFLDEILMKGFRQVSSILEGTLESTY